MMIRNLLFSLPFLILLFACAGNEENSLSPISPNAEEMGLHITLDYSETSPSTRAEEGEAGGGGETVEPGAQTPPIQDALVLLFIPDGNGRLSETSPLWKAVAPSVINPQGKDRCSFDIRVSMMSQEVPPALEAIIWGNGAKWKEDIENLENPTYADIAELTIDKFSNRSSGLSSNNDSMAFTFWGKATKKIDTSILVQQVKASLIRDLAKTTVVLGEKPIEEGNLISSLMIYNSFVDISQFPRLDSQGEGIFPSIPSEASQSSDLLPTKPSSEAPSFSILHPEQDILMKSENCEPSDENIFLRPALIVGLNWHNSGKIYYYRVDYIEDGLLIDVMRNHHYVVNVTAVKGPGADTPEEAYHSIIASVEASITTWTDVENDVEFDGDNWIAMVRTVELDSKAGSTASLPFLTNVEPENWEMAWGNAESDMESLPFSKDDILISSDKNFSVKKGSTLEFTALNDLAGDMDKRGAQLYINVTPRLRLVVNVVQSSASTSGNMLNWNDQTLFDEI